MSASIINAAVISGLLNGGLYALLALAIVLIFRTTGVANFAQGDMAMFSAFLLIMVFLPLGLPLVLAWIATILAAAIFGALIYLILIRPRPTNDHLNLTVRTMGLYILLYASAVVLWGGMEPYQVPSLFAAGAFRVGTFSVGYDQLGTILIAVGIAVAFLSFFRLTQTGLAMRAVSSNPEVASLMGVNVTRISLVVWMMAGMLAAVTGMLIAPITFLESGLMRPYLLKAFTAAILGGLTSFPGAIVGGFILGIAEAFAGVAISLQMREPFTFAILLLVLLIRPAGIFGAVSKVRV